jgi:structure-specific endonuclease subunit SLX1
MSWNVYLLLSNTGLTYVGATVDLDHRLRQHNGELAGGAHATHMRIAQGNAWERVCHIRGFPDWRTALQFEWALKHHSRKLPLKMLPIERRMRGLHILMKKDRSTSKSVPYSTYPEGGPCIVWEIDEAKRLYESIS